MASMMVRMIQNGGGSPANHVSTKTHSRSSKSASNQYRQCSGRPPNKNRISRISRISPRPPPA